MSGMRSNLRVQRDGVSFLALLIGLCVFGPTVADAGCGDYVLIGGAAAHRTPQLDHVNSSLNGASRNELMSLSMLSSMRFQEIQYHSLSRLSHRPLKRRQTPCHGPSCSNHSKSPVVPASKLSTIPSDHVALIINARQPGCDESFSFLAVSDARGTTGDGLRILRPPRP